MFLQKSATRILAESKAGIVLRALSGVGAAILLAACSEPLKPPSDADRVRIVLYHPLQSGDAMKTVGDWAMLSSGELVQIQTSTWLAAVGLAPPALAVPEQLFERDSRKWEVSIERRVGLGNVEMLMDRRNGTLCFDGACRRLHAICPPIEALIKHGAKCRSFSIN